MPTEAERARDEAVDRVERNAPDAWKRRALEAVRYVASRRGEFTTDAVWDLVGTPPEPRAMGAVMQAAARSRICAVTDRTHKSVRKECHTRPLAIWRSLIVGQAVKRPTVPEQSPPAAKPEALSFDFSDPEPEASGPYNATGDHA